MPLLARVITWTKFPQRLIFAGVSGAGYKQVNQNISMASRILKPGQLFYLMADEPHSIRAIADAVVLLTIIFKG